MIILATLMIAALLLFMVGFGLDVGVLTYTRNLGQTAVDAAALSAASGVSLGFVEVAYRAGAFNATNTYPGSKDNPITGENVELVRYDAKADSFKVVSNIHEANGARVSLKLRSPTFLVPGAPPMVSVTATAVLKSRVDLPLALKGCSLGVQTLNDTCWTVFDRPLSGELDEMIKNPTCSSIPGVDVGSEIDVTPADQGTNYDTLNTHGPFDGRQCYVVPVVEASGKCNKQNEPVVSFANICLMDVQSHRIQAEVKTCDLTTLLGVPSRCAHTVLVRDRAAGM